ncbi:IS3 family transposase [Streptomyces microflavus]
MARRCRGDPLSGLHKAAPAARRTAAPRSSSAAAAACPGCRARTARRAGSRAARRGPRCRRSRRGSDSGATDGASCTARATVARCTVERLMRELGITGAVRGRKIITTIPDSAVERAPDLLDRNFVAAAPNRCWVADFTHVKTWSAVVYVAFVVDTFSRRIVGWSAATSKETRLVLDALDMALWQRDRDEQPHQRGELIHHSDAGSQYTSFRLAEHLDAAGIAASIGSVGDAYDNALMESAIGLFKTELIKPGRP